MKTLLQVAPQLFGQTATGVIRIGVLNLCTPKANALRANLVSRTVLGWYMAGALSVLAAMLWLQASERHWMKADQLFPTWTSETHANALEERNAMETWRNLTELFEFF